MGCFSKPETPTVRIPEAPVLPTAKEMFSEAQGVAGDIAPLAMGARESALANIGQMTPEAGFFEGFQPEGYGEISPDFFGQYQPTSFEEGIAGTFFEDALRQAKRTAGHRASLGGIESAFPDLFAQAISPTMMDIGRYMGDMGQRRGELALGRQDVMSQLGQRQAEQTLAGRQQGLLSQLSIDPMNILRGYVDPALSQSQTQGHYDWQRNQAKAQADYINELNEFERDQAFAKQMGFFSPLAAWGYGGPEAGMGSIQDAFSMVGIGQGYDPYSANMGGGGMSQYGNIYGSNTPYGAQDMGNYSALPQGQGFDFGEMLGKAGKASAVFL